MQKSSKDSPLLLVLDDCHAADEASISLLCFVARHIRQSRIVVLVTYREEDLNQRPSLRAHFSSLAREGTTISLAGLSGSETAELARDRTGRALGRGSAKRLFESTEGNPFFVKEVLRIAADSATAADDPEEFLLENIVLPEQLEEAIRLRIRPLSEATKNLLRLASVEGTEFELDSLFALVGLDEGQIGCGLDEATKSGVISPIKNHRRRFRFTHGLFARVLYQDLSLDKRREAHLSLGRLLAKTSETPSDAMLPRVAHHLLQALPAGETDVAIKFGSEAAERATTALAYEDAARWYERTVRAIESQGDSRSEERCELLIRRAEALHRAGLFRQSKEGFEDLISLARDSRKGEWFARAVLGLGLLPTTPGSTDRTRLALLEEALSLLDPRDGALRARLMAQMAEAMQWTDQDSGRISMARESVAMARRLDDAVALEDCLYRSHVALSGPDSLEQRLAISSEFLLLAQRHRAASTGLRAHYLRLRDLMETGPIEEVEREVSDYIRIVDQFRQRHVGIAEAALAMKAMLQGDFDEAERLALEALTLGQDRRDGLAPQAFAAQMTMIKREQGRIAEIEPIIRGIVSQFPDLLLARCGLAFCYSEDRRLEDARFEFERLAASGFSSIRRDVSWLSAHVLLADVCASLEDSEKAELLYNALYPYGQRHASLDMYVSYGPVALYLGMLAALTHKPEAAEAHYEDALHLSRLMGSRPWFARSQHCYARMLAARAQEGDLERAKTLNDASLAIARSLKMKDLEKKAVEFEVRFSNRFSREVTGAQSFAEGRRLSTVLFIDMVGSTELAAKQGDKQWLQTLNTYLSVVRGALSKLSGKEIESSGRRVFSRL